MRHKGDGPAAAPAAAMMIGAWTETFPSWRPTVLHQEARIVVLDAGMGAPQIRAPGTGQPGAEWAHLRLTASLSGTYTGGGELITGSGAAVLYPPAYHDVPLVTLAYSESIARALRRLVEGLYRLRDELGPPADFAEYALRAAQLLRVRAFIRWDAVETSDHLELPEGGVPVLPDLGESWRTDGFTPVNAADAAAHARAQVATFAAQARAAAARSATYTADRTRTGLRKPPGELLG